MSFHDDVAPARNWSYSATCARCLDPITLGAAVAHVPTPGGELSIVHPECVRLPEFQIAVGRMTGAERCG